MSLHSTTIAIRKFIKWTVIICGVLLVIIMAPAIIRSLTPKKADPPTVSFGKLPPVAFPQSTATPPSAGYVINTIDTKLPLFPDRAAVYTVQQYQSDLLDLDNAKALINRGDFPDAPQALSEVEYLWTNPKPPYKNITYNILTHDFMLKSSYTTDPSIITANDLGDEIEAIAKAKQFLTGFNAFTDDIDEAKTKTTLYSINGTTKELQPAISLATTQIIRVDFFQKDVNELPVYYPNPPYSTISILVGAPGLQRDQIVEAEVNRKIITEENGTYPIKTAERALMELETASPSAYIATAANPPTDPVSIQEVFLGYYVGREPQLYLMPIVVFQGSNGFFAYVNAVTEEWIEKKQN